MLLLLLACRETESPPVPTATDVIVARHPDIATVLTVSWTQRREGEAWLSWVTEGEPQRSPPRARAPGPASEVVLGVPSETLVDELELHVVVGDREQSIPLGSMSTGPLPPPLLDGELLVMDEPSMRPEPWLLTSLDVGDMSFYGPWYTLILDRRGRIVWYLLTPDNHLTWQTRVSRSGDALLVEAMTIYSFVDPAPGTLTEITLDHRLQQTHVLPGMFSVFEEMPDGSWLFEEREDEFGYFLSHEDAAGVRRRIWSCDPWMAEYSRRIDNCATNTIVYHEERNSALWSSYSRGIVVEIDLETGEILREFGAYPGGYTIDPPEADFERQHYPNWTEDGTLLMSVHDPATGLQMAREYEVDDATQTLRQVWSAQTEHFAQYGGQILALPSGNRLWQLGTGGVIQEITREGEVVWQLQWPAVVVGNVTPLADLYALSPPPG